MPSSSRRCSLGSLAQYSPTTIAILVCMIVSGAFRTIAVKYWYRMHDEGSESPFFITLLYLFGQSLSLVVHRVGLWTGLIHIRKEEENGIIGGDAEDSENDAIGTAGGDVGADNGDVGDVRSGRGGPTKTKHGNDYPAVYSIDDDDDDDDGDEGSSDVGMEMIVEGIGRVTDRIGGGSGRITNPQIPLIGDSDGHGSSSNGNINDATPQGPQNGSAAPTIPSPARPPLRRSGSQTGLSATSTSALAHYIHSIPPRFKPAVPGFFNLLNSAMRWGCLVYLPASTADMLVGGLELVLSAAAARVVRRRSVSARRWGGVLCVAVGLVVVRMSEELIKINGEGGDEGVVAGVDGHIDDAAAAMDGDDNDATSSLLLQTANHNHRRLIGDILVVGQCIMSVCQDMAEELFMHESHIPPTLLLGYEGLFGLSFGLPLYLLFAKSSTGEDPYETWTALRSSSFRMGYAAGLVLLFTTVGVLNIVATSVTSSMTRNVWKNFRSAAVWMLGLWVVDVGEVWRIPGSLVTLLGFFAMTGGVVLYYYTGPCPGICGCCHHDGDGWRRCCCRTDAEERRDYNALAAGMVFELELELEEEEVEMQGALQPLNEVHTNGDAIC